MKIATCVFVILGALSLAASPALAAQTVLGTRVGPVTLTTGTSAGHCLVSGGVEAGSILVSCDDGEGNRALGDSFRGCLTTAGRGSCVAGLPPLQPLGEASVQCPGGNHFEISTGDDGGSCPSPNRDGDGKITSAECRNNDGETVSRVDCSLNEGQGHCDGVSGKGTCKCTTCKK